MSKAKERRGKKKSAARRRAAEHSSGYSTSVLKMPEGWSFFEMKEGIKSIDIIPFKAKDSNPFASAGEEYYERTFWIYRKIGAEEKSYCAIGKTFGKKDPIQDWKAEQADNPDADPVVLKALVPKERQLFIVHDHSDPGKLKLWEVSHHTFGKLLDSRVDNSTEESGWEFFYCADEDGMTLRCTFEENTGGSFKFVECTAIDFLPRGELAPELANHGQCLDDLLVEKSYKDMKNIFLCVSEDDGEDDDVEGDGGSTVEEDDEPAVETNNVKKEEKESPKKEKAKKESKPGPEEGYPLAEDFGLSRGDSVTYKGEKCTILKVSKDGTSLTLENETTEEIEGGVGPEEVYKGGEEKEPAKKEKPKKETAKKEKKGATEADNDEEWSF